MRHLLHFALALVLATTTEASSSYDGANNNKNPSLHEILQLIFRGGKKEGGEVTPQKISVIGAGQGRTGTTSLLAALKRLGLKSYHMKEGVMETPGHMDLWHAYYHEKSITMDDVLDRIEADGFNATLDAPTNFFFERQFARNPDAKVILSLRSSGGGESWAKSMHESVLLFHPLLLRAPFRWMSRTIKQSQFLQQMNREFGTPVSGPASIPVREYMAEAYDKWTEHVKATIPPEQLLIFYPQDGWKSLCQFLSPLSNEIEANCQQVLAADDPFPHVNDTAFIQSLATFFGAICTFVEWFPALLALMLLIIMFARRFNNNNLAATTSNIKSKAKRS